MGSLASFKHCSALLDIGSNGQHSTHIILLKPTNSKDIYVLKHNLLQGRSKSTKKN